TVSAGDHIWQQCRGEEKRRPHVHVEHHVERLDVLLQRRRERERGSVVDQHVDLTDLIGETSHGFDGLGARRRVIDLADAGLPGEAALFELTLGLQRTKIAGTLVTSGMADALGEDSRDPADLARELGFDPDVATRLIDTAVASRLMRLDRDGRARLSRLGAHLCTSHPRSIASWVSFIADPDSAA